MARIPDEEVRRLKQEISLERLATSQGVELKRHGADLIGLCPFHDDKNPSLVITPKKNLWHCLGACQAGGSVIDWMMKAEGVSFRHAVELLRGDLGATAAAKARGTTLASPVHPEAEDATILSQVVDYYHHTLKQSPEALRYLEERGLQSSELIERFRLGFANRTLGYRLPTRQTRDRLQELGVIRASGHEHFNGSLVFPIFNEEGRVVEMYGRKATAGYKLRKGTLLHLYLPGPHRGVFNFETLAASKTIILCESLIDALTFWSAGFRGVTSSYGVSGFGEDHLAAFRRYGTERVLIAYDRDEAGEKAATALASKLMSEGIECFRIQFPKGMDANEYACKVKPAEKSLGVLVRHAVWLGKGKPRQVELEALTTVRETVTASNGNGAVAPVSQPAGAKAAAAVTTNAEEPAGPRRAQNSDDVAAVVAVTPELTETPVVPSTSSQRAVAAVVTNPPAVSAEAPVKNLPGADVPAANVELDQVDDDVENVIPGSRATADVSPPTPAPPQDLDAVFPPSSLAAKEETSSGSTIPTEIKGEEVLITFGDRRYRVRGLSKNMSYDQLKVNLLASRGEGLHVDTLDMYSSRQRTTFIKQAAAELGAQESTLKREVGQVLLKLEELQDEQIKKALEPQVKEVALSQEEQATALKLLKDPRLVERILTDFQVCGVVGEQTNKLLGYLAAVSRKLEEPLAVIIQSSSAAGKTALMDAILSFMPEEERVKYSAMTGQSLFYMGESDLKHKILAIVEEQGAERATYALKLLQSEGELTIASTGKDPATGRLVTQEYRVEGPVMIFLTTTAIEVDEELLNRCLVLSVDEDREQTKAIHRMQREKQTLEGLLARQTRPAVLKVHQDAQRLLKPLLVANPYARHLTFLDDRTRTRRDHVKYLTLIRAIALLHQYRREVKTVEHRGQAVPYIEVTLEDIAIANQLAHQVLGRSLDELAPQTRRLLEALDRIVGEASKTQQLEREEVRFSRKLVRQKTSWTYDQVRVHLDRLVQLEYVLVHQGGRGQSFEYELVYDGQGGDGRPFLPGLIDVEALKERSTTDSLGGLTPQFGGPLGCHWGVIGGPLGGADPTLSDCNSSTKPTLAADPAKNAHLEASSQSPSRRSRTPGNGGVPVPARTPAS